MKQAELKVIEPGEAYPTAKPVLRVRVVPEIDFATDRYLLELESKSALPTRHLFGTVEELTKFAVELEKNHTLKFVGHPFVIMLKLRAFVSGYKYGEIIYVAYEDSQNGELVDGLIDDWKQALEKKVAQPVSVEFMRSDIAGWYNI